MLKQLVIFLFLGILNAYKVDNSNSIYNVSYSAKTNALGRVHIISNNVNGIFNQPINKKKINRGDSYYSYIKYFDNLFNVYHFGICLLKNSNENINFGIIKRSINKIPNTANAWEFNLDGPEFNQINYDNITFISDSEIGFLISYNRKIKNDFILDFKLKPSFHTVNNRSSQAFSLDLVLSKSKNYLEFVFGCDNVVSYKKWEMGTAEIFSSNPFFNLSINLKNLFFTFETSQNLAFQYGLEYEMFNSFFVRIGSENSYGLGIKTNAINFNYAYVNDSENQFNALNQFSLIVKLKGLKKIYDEINI